ncbi:MAG: hypothetical protein R3A51_02140 [Nannocystaceae bacterium]
MIRLPEEYNTELAPALALHNNDLFFAYVDTSGAAYVLEVQGTKPERVRVFRDQTTRKPRLDELRQAPLPDFVDHRGKAYVISSENGEEWPTYYDRIFPGHITRLQVPLAVSGEQLLAKHRDARPRRLEHDRPRAVLHR